MSLSRKFQAILGMSLILCCGQLGSAIGQDCCQQIRSQLEQGKSREAIEEGRAILNLLTGQQRFELLTLLGAASYQLGNYGDAIQFWEEGITLEPAQINLKLDLAQAWLNQGNYAQVRRLLSSLPEDRYREEKAAISGNLAFAEGNFGQAIEKFEASLPLLSDTWTVAITRNLVLSYAQQAEQYSALAEDASEDDRHGLRRKAEFARQKAQAYARNSEDLAVLIWRWRQSGEKDEERQYLIAKVNKMPQSANKGHLLLQVNDYDAAIQVAKSVRNSQLEIDSLIAKAVKEGELKFYEEAQGIAAFQGNWLALFEINYRLGSENLKQGKNERAKAYLKTAYQNLTHFIFINNLSVKQKQLVLSFFKESIPVFLGDDHADDLRFARQLLKSNQILQVAIFYNIPCSIETSKLSVSKEQMILYYFFADDRGYLLVENNEDLSRKILPISRSEIIKLATTWQQSLRDIRSSDYKIVGKKLYDLLIKPIDFKGLSKIGIVADTTLQGIPFAALYSGDRFLIEERQVSYLSRGLEASGSPKGTLLAMGASEFRGEVSPLPSVTQEIDAAVAAIGGDSLKNQQFTQQNIVSLLSKNNHYSLVHIATHGYFGGNAESSWLQTYDDRLSVAGLSQILLTTSPLRLLVLSGCETGKGNSRMIYGLAGIGLQLRASSIISTLWAVNDHKASRLMSNFYQEWAQNRSASAALQKAQIQALKNPAQHPNDWAGFIVLD